MATAKIRTGFSTGACAAAAAKAAALALAGRPGGTVDIRLPDGRRATLPIKAAQVTGPERAWAEVVKDASDDPDITKGVIVRVDLEILGGDRVGPCTGDGSSSSGLPRVEYVAGEGVGTVTRAGLQIGVGEPAINPVPRMMIAEALKEALGERRCRVTVSIPGGQDLAERTFNSRLGIVGGLSVLGTSGRVIPRSEEAWLRSLLPQVDVALAAGERTLYLAPGGFGERVACEALGAPVAAVVRCSNFIGALLDACAERGMERIVLIGHAGKLVKVAAGIFDTHSRHGDARLETLGALAGAAGAPAGLIARLLELPTIEAAIPVLEEAGLGDVWDDVADRAAGRSAARAARAARAAAQAPPQVDCALVGYDGVVVGRSERLRGMAVPPGSDALPAITVVGTGPGTEELATPAAWQALRRAEVVVGGARQLARFASEQAEQIVIGADMDAVEAGVRDRLDRRIVILASGDPTCYGILSTLRRRLPEIKLDVVPGISSFQLALARLQLGWEAVRFASAHGKDLEEVMVAVREHPRVLALTDPLRSPQAVAKKVLQAGIEGRMTVFERLGHPEENITRGDLSKIASGCFDPLSVVFVETGHLEPGRERGGESAVIPVNKASFDPPPGIPDDQFVRGDVPMTKAEVRALLMAKAHLHPGARVLDVGAGSGSLTVEARLLCPEGEVVAIERDREALTVLQANLDRFDLPDVRIIAGEAPEAWAGLGRFDRVFVGGSGGRLPDILAVLPSILLPGGRAICPCVCVENLYSAVSYLRGEEWRGCECVQVSIARGVSAGSKLRFDALNPVWIVSAEVAGPHDAAESGGEPREGSGR